MLVQLVQAFIQILALNLEEIDETYEQMLEDGLSYGMTIREFWEMDLKGYITYQKAYLRKLHRESHIQGLYFNLAIISNVSSILGKKGSKPTPYPDEDLYTTESVKQEKQRVINATTKRGSEWIDRKHITKENMEEAFTQRMNSYY
ncbi:MAG: hypothetical protein R3Y05_01315 [bacterium]